MNILVSGAGIAGLACALELGTRGHDVTVVECASHLRSEGTPIDIRGDAIEAADRMGLLAKIQQKRVRMSELTQFIDGRGEPVARIPLADINDSDDDVELLRADLIGILADALPDTAAIRFGDSIETLTDDGAGMNVRFASRRSGRYDVVVGADGLHSAVRTLVFGPEDDFVRHLGVYFALADHPGEPRFEDMNSIYNVPGRMAAVFRYGGRAVAVFQFRSEPIDYDHHDLDAEKKILIDAFAGYRSWRIPELLDAVRADPRFYFTSASQVHLPSWHRGRVVLVGDAGVQPGLPVWPGHLTCAHRRPFPRPRARTERPSRGRLHRYIHPLRGPATPLRHVRPGARRKRSRPHAAGHLGRHRRPQRDAARMTDTLETPAPVERGHRWSGRLILWTPVLILANVLADMAIGSPMMVLPQLLERFDTDQAPWLSTSAMLAGAIWSPLLAKSADVFGKRRILVATLLLACAGALVCLAASNLWIFLVGRFLQGAAFAAVFLTVALVLQICTPGVAMAVVGLVTSGSSFVGIVEPFLLKPVIDAFGYRSVFAASALLAAVAALCVRAVIPESPIRDTGRIDLGGALLLGAGLGAVLAYVSLGRDLGWLSGGMIVLLVTGASALAGWAFLALRVDEPLIDIRALRRPILLTLLALVLAAGAFRSMLQLTSIIAQVPPGLGLGYGLGNGEAVAVLLAAPNVGIVIGGVCAGWIAGRVGPAPPLLGGIAVGTMATFAMIVGVSVLPLAVACGALVGMAAGAIGTSGYNLATSIERPERQGLIAGLVSVMMALGSVVFSFAGGEVLKATQISGTSAGGATVSTATGVYLYVGMAGALFVLAAVPAVLLTCRPATPG
jgi:2-polyprenyl-6-methoxyphenol hydroxylase-like FAD-dependent oxidoreductase/MFS family permease